MLLKFTGITIIFTKKSYAVFFFTNKLLMYRLAQENETAEPTRLATTNPHQTPLRPKEKVQQNIIAKIGDKIIVLRSVAIKE